MDDGSFFLLLTRSIIELEKVRTAEESESLQDVSLRVLPEGQSFLGASVYCLNLSPTDKYLGFRP